MRLRPFSLIVRLTLIVAVCLTAVNLLVLAVRFPAYAALPLGYAAWKRLGRWRLSTAHGQARASGLADLLARGMLGSRGGLILGTTGYMEPPGMADGLAALFNVSLPSTLAVRLFLASFFGKQWMGE